MDTVTIFLAASIFLYGLSFLPYLLAIYGRSITLQPIERGTPSKVTWLVFVIMDLIVVAGMYNKGVLNWMIVASTITSMTILIISLYRGVPGWRLVDVACLLIASTGIVFWIVFWEANWAIIFGCAALLAGILPTLDSVWKRPASESLLSWAIYVVAVVCLFPTLPSYGFAGIIQPITSMLISSSVVVTCILSRHRHRRA